MLLDQINQDLKAAMLARDEFTKITLQGIKSAVGYAAVDKKADLTDEEITKLLQKEVKQRAEAEEMYRQGGNVESADKEKAEAKLISKYLPEMAGEEDIMVATKEAIKQTGASTPRDMGKVIGVVKGKFGAAADGGLISRIAKEELS